MVRHMEKLLGRHCKIITREPGAERASIIIGILEDINYEDGFIIVESDQGMGLLKMDIVVAIKPYKN